ncbi:riboflavin synthase [Virgibacillus pantothenticus]|uniref:Riboflavin synthase n=1 Tax=Virgibacillus pantothenticus TaxID=1473 RepID=A0A0L0QRQ3_VIRPA|nr:MULTISPECIES: riboflavin synthase [Virgibacillus]API94162.1 riboflavin synthase subunit alpha [Virgibacillus sp. 6R]KNE20873.1 riboflavin synthase subunit alpha [Virgibacillus pantothenticus]MBS7426579.1 riboflavin synthase [Virgibacillus sp. 19R1-5]MBU8567236.1 riboflavin synthase [Virgibacillus pantothenticus]MBU8599992.1 riboflavin synthase [Virgibacillus pantothenticus]
MFTGIIEEQGQVASMKHISDQAIVLRVKASTVLNDVQMGDSIAINGICLTVTSFDEHSFTVDVMPETVNATSLRSLRAGSSVNLERAMAANERFGGHIVSGHVDGIGEIIRKQREQNAIYYDIEIPASLARYVITKGSVAIDGVSLTVFQVKQNFFTISLIPYTASITILGEKEVGDVVNIECDMLIKHVEHLLTFASKKEILDEAYLRANGFM